MKIDDNNNDNGVFVGHAPCTECGSEDNVGVYEASDGTNNGTCFGCGK